MSMSEIITTIGSILAVIASAFAIYTALHNKGKDDNSAGKVTGSILSELGYIKSQLDRIIAKQDKQDEFNMEVSTRLAQVEASAKQAHKRIDHMEGRDYHNG